eukprot:scaffold7400_cov122-Skeletonema_menzelii.AAC.3
MADFLRWASGYKSDATPTAFSLTPGESRDEPLLCYSVSAAGLQTNSLDKKSPHNSLGKWAKDKSKSTKIH